ADASTSLRPTTEWRDEPRRPTPLRAQARELGADVPFFLEDGPQLGSGDGSELTPLDLPQDYWVLLVVPRGSVKRSTKDVYDAFDARRGERGYAERRVALLELLGAMHRP